MNSIEADLSAASVLLSREGSEFEVADDGSLFVHSLGQEGVAGSVYGADNLHVS